MSASVVSVISTKVQLRRVRIHDPTVIDRYMQLGIVYVK